MVKGLIAIAAGRSLPAHTGSRAGSQLFQSCALGKSRGHALTA